MASCSYFVSGSAGAGFRTRGFSRRRVTNVVGADLATEDGVHLDHFDGGLFGLGSGVGANWVVGGTAG